jgi:Rho GTPase-activating protein 39
MKIDRNKTSPANLSGHSSINLRTIQQINQMLKPSNSLKSPTSHHSQEAFKNSLSKSNKNSLKYSKEPTLDRKMPGTSSSTGKSRKKTYTTNTNDMENDNGNMSPLYTNWDTDMHEHLLPLQHYILEQAKLSGFQGQGHDPYDSDSIHSESHSEHSVSDHDTGHEPDNEDSDGSEGRGEYLAHNPYEDYGAFRGPSYYNYEQNFNRNMSREDM